MKLCLIGSGSFGSTMAILLAKNVKKSAADAPISMFIRRPELLGALRDTRAHPDYAGLRTVPFPRNIAFTDSLSEALYGATHCVFAVPSRYAADTLGLMAPHCDRACRVISLVKGFYLDHDAANFYRISELIQAKLNVSPQHVATLGGPNIYTEILDNFAGPHSIYRPTNAVISSSSLDTAREFQEFYFSRHVLRTYVSQDVIAAEVCGALKNVYAIAAGAADKYRRVGKGVNFKASLITRAAFEIGYFVRALGASQDGVYGLAGVGDLIATCSAGRNWSAGGALIEGAAPETVEQEALPNALEGFQTLRAMKKFLELMRERNPELQLELPILEGIYEFVFNGLDFDEGAKRIIDRPMKMERRSDPYVRLVKQTGDGFMN